MPDVLFTGASLVVLLLRRLPVMCVVHVNKGQTFAVVLHNNQAEVILHAQERRKKEGE